MAAAKGHSRSCYRISRTLAVFVAVQCVGLAFFIRGFLLTRVQLDATSPLDDLRVVNSAGAPGAPVLGHDAPFDRAVLLVVDALRVDALVKQPYTVPGRHVEAMPGLRQLAHDLVRPLPDRLWETSIFRLFQVHSGRPYLKHTVLTAWKHWVPCLNR